MSGGLIASVAELLREAAARAILPRFRALADGDVEEKTPGELVTIADREAETLIARGLSLLRPDARIVGEEACAANPSILDRLDEGSVWLIDPLDGTGNFVAGETPFAVMVALLVSGETVAAWMLDPVTDRLAAAESGGGAYMDEARIRTSDGSPGPSHLRGMVGRFMPSDVRDAVMARAAGLSDLSPTTRCAGADYPIVATGERNFALFWRTLPWDHAAGALFLGEAGGKVARPDGSAYRPGSTGSGLLVAQNEDVWRDAHAALLR